MLNKHTLCYQFKKSRHKKLKLILKNTVIHKTLTYASETSILTKRDRKQLEIFWKEGVSKNSRPSILQWKSKLEGIN
jgi:hypothetical protein